MIYLISKYMILNIIKSSLMIKYLIIILYKKQILYDLLLKILLNFFYINILYNNKFIPTIFTMSRSFQN